MNDTVEQVPLHLDITTSNFYWMQMQQQVSTCQERLGMCVVFMLCSWCVCAVRVCVACACLCA